MYKPAMSFTAVYLKSKDEYVGFIEELPGVTSSARTLEGARVTLRELATVVFDEERRNVRQLLEGKDVVREEILLSIGRPSDKGR